MFQCFLFFIGSGLNDGQWHEVRFLAKENFAVLTIDGDEASAVRTNSPLQVKTGEKYFFGGKKKKIKTYMCFKCLCLLIYIMGEMELRMQFVRIDHNMAKMARCCS